MKLIMTDNYEQLSKMAALYLMRILAQGFDGRLNVFITGGATPVGAYHYASKLLQGRHLPNVHYYNFDEIPLKNREGATLASLRELFFEPCGIAQEQIEVFDADNYQTYDQKLQDDGGLDFIMMGLGADGHFCGNIAGSFDDFAVGCHTVDSYLNEWLAGLMEEACNGKENIPDWFVTFGPKTVMSAKELLLIVSGQKKAEILQKALEGPITPAVPASILRLHPKLTVIADREAASGLKEDRAYG